jgi:prepilin-type N-terminal cleavage/methylation domain-containing protein
MNNRHNQPAGFTLLELLVSLTLTGLLAVAILFGYRVAFNAWSKGEASMESVRSRYVASDLLTRQIGCMVPYYFQQKVDEATLDLLLFGDKPEYLCFVSTFSAQYRQSGGNQLVQYFLGPTEDNRNKVFWVQETPLPNDEALSSLLFSSISKDEVGGNFIIEYKEPQKKPTTIPLFAGINSLSFEYWERILPSAQKGQATPDAKKKKMLPAGIRIKIGWSEEGPFREKETTLNVPINAYYEKKKSGKT